MTMSSERSSMLTLSPSLIGVITVFLLAFHEFVTSGHAATPKKFVVFGSSGKTGVYIVKRIFSENIADCQVICPVRDMSKARLALGPESKKLSLVPCDLINDEKEKFTSLVSGADAVIICSAYSPGALLFQMPFEMTENCCTCHQSIL